GPRRHPGRGRRRLAGPPRPSGARGAPDGGDGGGGGDAERARRVAADRAGRRGVAAGPRMSVGESTDAYEWLRSAIVGGRLQPNERLVEADLTRATGASRSAVRTALVRLAQEGLVEHERNRGARVRLVDEQEAA